MAESHRLADSHRIAESPATAVVAIWAGAAVTSLLSPDMVTGSEQEHLPIALATVWVGAALATAYAVMTPRGESRASWTVAVCGVWVLTAVVGVLSPVLETGSDPTRIPLAVLIVPPVAAAATGLLSLRQATRGTR